MNQEPNQEPEEQPLVVTTIHKGVFFGYGTFQQGQTDIVLHRARMAIYWSEETKGVVGLAVRGPQKGSRITSPAPKIFLNGLTSIMLCTAEARQEWEKGT